MATVMQTPVFTSDEAITHLRQAVHAKAGGFYAMYSSHLGGIVTDPALMVLPLDDHMVHRGHAVFDTAMIVGGKLYQLEAHLERFLRSAGWPSPTAFAPHRRQIIIETCRQWQATPRCVTGCRPGLVALGCHPPNVWGSFYVMIFRELSMPSPTMPEV
jgi:4-amino-4-deoxychorismate lyase